MASLDLNHRVKCFVSTNIILAQVAALLATLAVVATAVWYVFGYLRAGFEAVRAFLRNFMPATADGVAERAVGFLSALWAFFITWPLALLNTVFGSLVQGLMNGLGFGPGWQAFAANTAYGCSLIALGTAYLMLLFVWLKVKDEPSLHAPTTWGAVRADAALIWGEVHEDIAVIAMLAFMLGGEALVLCLHGAVATPFVESFDQQRMPPPMWGCIWFMVHAIASLMVWTVWRIVDSDWCWASANQKVVRVGALVALGWVPSVVFLMALAQTASFEWAWGWAAAACYVYTLLGSIFTCPEDATWRDAIFFRIRRE